MREGWKIILVHLLAQLLFGPLILMYCFKQPGFDGPLGAMGLVNSYLGVAVAFILVSTFALSQINKQPREVLVKGFVASCLLWFFGPLLYFIVDNKITEMQDQRDKNKRIESIKRESLAAANLMNLNSYSWNSSINQCTLQKKDSKLQYFYVSSGNLYISTNIVTPTYNDTLAWLDSTLNEASPYLNPWTYKVLDSCIRSRSFSFVCNDNSYVKLSISPLGSKNAVKLTGEVYDRFNCNFLITLKLEAKANIGMPYLIKLLLLVGANYLK